MKNLINLGLMLLTVIVMTSCPGPKSSDPEPEVGSITLDELSDYYFVAQKKSGQKLLVLYFTKDGNTITTNAHLKTALRQPEVTIKNSTLTLDFDSNGASIYTFDLEKDASGNIKLKSYNQVLNGEANQLSHAVMGKKANAEAFSILSSFKAGSTSFRFSNVVELTSVTNYFHWTNGVKLPYYHLDKIGFKTNKDEFMGVMVPNWIGVAGPAMLIEDSNNVYIGTRQ